MNIDNITHAYFLGIGGIGMSAIARYFQTMGLQVAGYDKTETDLTKELIKEGIRIHYTDEVELMKSHLSDITSTLVILTPAVPKDHQEWNWLIQNGYTIQKRSQVLGLITDSYLTIGVAGTHGKTTTSTLIAHLLKQSRLDCAAFLGGISTNYGTNLLLHKEQQDKGSQWMVVEADEFDRSFLTLHPHIGIITSTDADHLDIYGNHEELKKSFLDYASQVSDTLIVKKGIFSADTFSNLKNKSVLTYSVHGISDVYAENIRITGDQYFFDLHIGNRILENLCLGIPGLHNVENAVAASAAAITAGISEEELREGLASFAGVKRRFEYIWRDADTLLIDDYAHHPEELKAIISSVKQMYQNRQVTVVFQPHLYTRTRDFLDGFAKSLSLADDIILLDIYPARELPIPGITSQIILDKITTNKKQLVNKLDLIGTLQKEKRDVILTLGAGDIDKLVPLIKQAYQNN